MIALPHNKFIVAPKHLGFGPNLAVLSDFNYWINNYDALAEWCNEHNAVIKGMTIEFSSADDVMLFALRWS